MTPEPPETRDNPAGKDDPLPTLLDRLSDPEKTVRAGAMHGLVRIGRPAVPACIALLQDDDWKVRYRAAEALGLIGDAAAYSPFIAALGDEKDHVRYMAAKGLGLLGDQRAVGQLTRMLHDENEFVRRISARSLGMLGGEEAIRALRTALKVEATGAVREAILAALDDAEAGRG